MSERSPHLADLTRHGAALRLREIAHELHLLLELFPDIEDAFDDDELPVSFIVKRDAWAAREASRVPDQATRAAARGAVARRMKQAWTERRAGSRS
jgi:hypothetical protein